MLNHHISRLTLIIALLLAAVMVVACGGGSEPAAEAPAPAAEEPAAEAPEEEAPAEEAPAEEEAPAASGDRVQIRWFVGLGAGSDPDVIAPQEAVVEAFNASQDEIELILDIVDNAQATEVLNTQIAAGNAPDIIGPVGVAGRAAFTDALLDINPLIEANNTDLSDFEPELVEFYNLEGVGQVGLPFGIFPSFIFYNADLFDEAGLPYPPSAYGEPYVDADGNELPWNMDTVRELAMLLTVDANGNDANSPDFDPEAIVQFGYGPQFTDVRGRDTLFGAGWYQDEDGNAVIPEHWVEAEKWYHDAMWVDYFMPNAVYGNSDLMNAGNWFESGNIGMTHVHLWYATCCVGGLEANWNVAPMPAAPDGTITAKMHGDTFSILKGTENPQEAYEVLLYLTGDGANDLVQIYGAMPARLSLQETYFDTLSANQFAGKDINWEVVSTSAAYPDNPNHEEGYPGELEVRAALDRYNQRHGNEADFDVEAGLEELRQELQAIFDANS